MDSSKKTMQPISKTKNAEPDQELQGPRGSIGGGTRKQHFTSLEQQVASLTNLVQQQAECILQLEQKLKAAMSDNLKEIMQGYNDQMAAERTIAANQSNQAEQTLREAEQTRRLAEETRRAAEDTRGRDAHVRVVQSAANTRRVDHHANFFGGLANQNGGTIPQMPPPQFPTFVPPAANQNLGSVPPQASASGSGSSNHSSVGRGSANGHAGAGFGNGSARGVQANDSVCVEDPADNRRKAGKVPSLATPGKFTKPNSAKEHQRLQHKKPQQEPKLQAALLQQQLQFQRLLHQRDLQHQKELREQQHSIMANHQKDLLDRYDQHVRDDRVAADQRNLRMHQNIALILQNIALDTVAADNRQSNMNTFYAGMGNQGGANIQPMARPSTAAAFAATTPTAFVAPTAFGAGQAQPGSEVESGLKPGQEKRSLHFYGRRGRLG